MRHHLLHVIMFKNSMAIINSRLEIAHFSVVRWENESVSSTNAILLDLYLKQPQMHSLERLERGFSFRDVGQYSNAAVNREPMYANM